MRSLRRSTAIAITACGLVAAACSGGSSTTTADATTSSAAPSTTAATTEAPIETTATTTTAPATTTTAAPAVPVAQFTGIEVSEALTRPALVVKIDNHQLARPQRGINAADVVFEELVEGNITRFAAIFHSQDADPIGPVRSARTGDFDLLSNLNTPLFGNSGGNPTVMGLLAQEDMILLSDANVGSQAYYRGGGRSAPHNLLTDTPTLFELADGQGGTPPQMFQYRTDDDALPETAEDVDIVRIDYGGYRIDYQWDPDVNGWARTQQGSAHVDADGVQIAPENVIVQFAEYGTSVAFAGSPEVRLVGTGEAWVLTQGRMIRATWTRPTEGEITEFRDLEGNPIKLTPGRTWVALPRPGSGFLIDS